MNSLLQQPQRALLLAAGMVGIIAFFLPFIHFVEVLFVNIHYSGWSLVEAGLDAADIGKFPRGRKLLNFLIEQWQSNQSLIDYIGFVGLLYILLGPLYFLYYALRYLLAALRNRDFPHGLVFLLTFTAFAWVGFYFGGQEYHVKINFFNRAGLGFWLVAVSVVMAFLSRFARKRLAKA
jgi:hypothetical protein